MRRVSQKVRVLGGKLALRIHETHNGKLLANRRMFFSQCTRVFIERVTRRPTSVLSSLLASESCPRHLLRWRLVRMCSFKPSMLAVCWFRHILLDNLLERQATCYDVGSREGQARFGSLSETNLSFYHAHGWCSFKAMAKQLESHGLGRKLSNGQEWRDRT